MIDRKTLLDDLKKLLPKLEADLLERSDSAEVPDVGLKLREEYAEAQAASRTAQSFTDWRSDAITQHAAAWVLSLVFVRFLEDNGLISTPAIAGPGERLMRARDEHEVYFRTHPTQTDRDYLLAVFDDLTKPAATRDVFGAHNPIRDLPNWLSGDAARTLLEFFQRIDPNTGVLVHDFTDLTWDTRFLGDLYQDLSETARKKFALLQTPVFVEEFILDRTLDPALEEFGLAKPGYGRRLEPDGRLHPDDRFKMIDPACGSGHFLLGSFARLLDGWRKKEPGTKAAILAQRALDGVHGVDLNPYAISIARFRLLLAALKDCGVTRLGDSPGFEMHLACGNSLLDGDRGQGTMGWAEIDQNKHTKDEALLLRWLRPKSYQAVVANPPYITPKDRALNQEYRDRYSTCHMKYSLAVPFLERIVSLAVDGGYTGQITANSFMKREFGKKLIESYFPRVDLTHVIDTSGAYIPGHGTPTVILFARNRKPVATTLRTVMGIRGEPSTPNDPSKGLVWSAIVEQVDQPGSQNEFVSVGDSPRELFHKHPWSIGGGGAAGLKEQVDEIANMRLADIVDSIGFLAITGGDDVFVLPIDQLNRVRLVSRPFCTGDDIRDWGTTSAHIAIFPYDTTTDALHPLDPSKSRELTNYLWKHRAILSYRNMFGKTVEQHGFRWFEYIQFIRERVKSPYLIAFACVATHNHFALDRGGNIFNRHAPVIKLVDNYTETDYLALLGLLNSSTACFWMKQIFHNKGSSVDQHGARQTTVPFENFWEHDGTKLKQFPLPDERPTHLSQQLDDLNQSLQSNAPVRLLSHWQSCGSRPGTSIKDLFARCERKWSAVHEQMIAIQEELDWECYRLYGLIDENLNFPGEPPRLRLGGRAFEIAMGAKIASGELQTTWFERHNSAPLPGPHPEWPQDYQDLVRRRMEVIATNSNIALIEQPEYKRRWNTEPWAEQRTRALRAWLLDRLESYFDFDGRMNDAGTPTARLDKGLTAVGRLADVARQDAEFLQVGELYRDDAAFDVSRLVAELVEGESVPLLPVLRYKPSGLRKRTEWEAIWALQRQEDAIDARAMLPKGHPDFLTELEADALKKKQVGTIPVPPKYASADFLKGDYWRLRGKLDVPKERWVSFPHCEGEDGTALVAWAGYDHLQLARAISTFYVDVQERLGGRDDPRLVPLFAGLIELLPWLKQWHNEVDPEFGVPMGDYFEGFLQEESRNLGLTLDEIKGWTPPSRGRSRRGGRRSGRSNETGE